MQPIKKIMLIYPPVTRPEDHSAEVTRVSAFFPLGMAYLAAAIEQTGKYELKVLDALIEGDFEEPTRCSDGGLRHGLSDQEIARKIEEFSPDVVGIPCLSSAMHGDMLNVCSILSASAEIVFSEFPVAIKLRSSGLRRSPFFSMEA